MRCCAGDEGFMALRRRPAGVMSNPLMLGRGRANSLRRSSMDHSPPGNPEFIGSREKG
jgi:hypothetical protein